MRVWLILWMITTWMIAALFLAPLAAQETAAADDRITFNVKLDNQQGGGRVEGWAGDFDFQEGEYLIARDSVEIKYRDLRLRADLVRIDAATSLLTAEGSIILDEGPRRLIGDTLEYHLAERTGRLTHATAFVENEYYFTGETIEKLDDETFSLDKGVFTSCNQEVPSWSIHMSHAKITIDDYARIKGARMKLKKVPIFYVPYMLWPTTTERSSGFLVPQPGYSNRRGAELGLAYFQTLGRSVDTTFNVELSSKDYFGFGNEIRYRPSGSTTGSFEAFLINDPEMDELDPLRALDPAILGFDPELLPDAARWKVSYHHESNDVWGGFRAAVNFQDFSDPTYRQDFERAVNRQSNSFIYSNAYLSRNFGQQSFNILVDLREQIKTRTYDPTDFGVAGFNEPRRVGEIIEDRRQLPEIEYRLRPTRIGNSSIYFNLDGNLHYLSVDSDRQGKSSYGRADLFTSFSVPVSTLAWLSVKLDVGGRATHYTNTINPATGHFFNDESDTTLDEKDKSLDRTFGVAGVEIVGPSFSKIFEKKKPGRFSKVKHIVEPRIEYVYRDAFDDPRTDADGNPIPDDDGEVPLFDEIDRFRPANQATFSFINRIMAKPSDPDAGSGFEILSFALEQPYSFDQDRPLQSGTVDGVRLESQAGPLRAILRFNPSRQTSVKAEARYNTLFSNIQSLSLSGGFRAGNHGFGGSLQTGWNVQTGEVQNNQARLFTSLALGPKVKLDASLSFDLEDEDAKNPLQQRYFLSYKGSCYTLQLELRESQFGLIEDRDFRFSFTLKNVGTFIDMNGSL